MNRKLFPSPVAGQHSDHRPALAPDRSRDFEFLHHLRSEDLIDDFGLARATAALNRTFEATETLLVELGLMEESVLQQALSQFLKVEVVTQSQFPPSIPDNIGADFDHLSRHCLVPLSADSKYLTIATPHPLNDDAARAVAYAHSRNLVLRLASSQAIQRHLAIWKATAHPDAESKEPLDRDGFLDGDTQRLKDLASEAPIIRLLERIIVSASDHRASDIHIEPHDDCVQIRFRVDGSLQAAETLEKSIQLGLVSRIKILARLNIAENRLPQDGRIRIPVRGRNIDFRIATTPMLHGEGVVMRLLDRRDIELDLSRLGFPLDVHRKLNSIIAAPNGIFVVTGPTGSGKTTTLYALVAALNKPATKIFTVEDPVEYHLRGINQVPVRPHIGLDFAAVLRSILRQDPDVIMVGEIRDRETARIAVQAALTGHLVLATLHTNSAVASVTRLRDLGIENFLLASTLRGIVAQRLVRKLCGSCKRNAGESHCAAGCPSCGNSGYHGRAVLCEAMDISVGVRGLIAAAASEEDITKVAVMEGMISIHRHACQLVTDGITSQDEVIRAIGVEVN